MNAKEKALDKMLDEMNQKHTDTEDVIHNWLSDQDDDELFKGVLKEDRTIKGSVQYCAGKARKQQTNNVAMVNDHTVFSWIREYFTSDKIKQEKVTAAVSTSKTTTKKEVTQKKKTKQAPLEGEQLDLLGFL